MARQRRRLLRFSLRTLLIVIGLFACVFGWLAWHVHRYRDEQRAIGRLKEAGVEVELESTLPAWLGNTRKDPRLWMFQRASIVNVRDAPVTDEGLRYVKNLRNLRELDLVGTDVTDTGLAYLSGLARLEKLRVVSPMRPSQISDAGIVQLKQLRKLRELDLECTQVTPQGLKDLLRSLPALEVNYSWLYTLRQSGEDVTLELGPGLVRVVFEGASLEGEFTAPIGISGRFMASESIGSGFEEFQDSYEAEVATIRFSGRTLRLRDMGSKMTVGDQTFDLGKVSKTVFLGKDGAVRVEDEFGHRDESAP